MRRSTSAARTWVEAHGPLAAAAAAAAASVPGLWLPFLSDDWHLLHAVREGPPPLSAFEYFRPLYMASYWLDLRLWGPNPALFHLTNLLLIAATAALAVILIRRYTNDPALAAASGLLFALHPSHVENAAWIAVRGDPLFAIPFLGAALAYDHWRAPAGFGGGRDEPSETLAAAAPSREPARTPMRAGEVPGAKRVVPGPLLLRRAARTFPLAAAALFLVALLAKESAVALPVLLAAVGLADRTRRPPLREWLRGFLPLAALGVVHLLVLRPLALGGSGRSLTPRFGLAWAKQAFGYVVAAVVPADVDQLAYRPALWAFVGSAAILCLLIAARIGSGRVPRVAAASAIVFAALLGPSIVGFQDRYLFLPAAASCVAIVSLARAASPPVAAIIAALVAGGWLFGWGWQWNNWRHAGMASEALVAGLVRASREPDVEEIEVVDMPFRVRHGSVQGDFRSALAVLGEREIPVLFDSELSLSRFDAQVRAGQVGEDRSGIRTLRYAIEPGPYSRWIYPDPEPGREIETVGGWIRYEDDRTALLRLRPPPLRRAVYEWNAGDLGRLSWGTRTVLPGSASAGASLATR